MGKKFAVFPEPGAIGPVMNLVGICQGLKEMGHEPVLQDWWYPYPDDLFHPGSN